MYHNTPTFTVFCGSMMSSKTSKLLMMLERYKYQQKRIAVFKPTIDERYSKSEVVTHGGWSIPSYTIKTGADILEILESLEEEPHVIAVDEAFMIQNISEVLIWLFRNGIDIVVSTLDISATGKPFNDVGKMMIWATHVEKCAAICTVCRSDAPYTYKKVVDESDFELEIEVGGAELYEPRCGIHHPGIFSVEASTKYEK